MELYLRSSLHLHVMVFNSNQKIMFVFTSPWSGDRIPVGGEIFRTCPDRPRGPPSLLYNGYRVFPGVNSGRGVTLTPHPLLVPLVMKEYSYKSTSPIGRTACTEPQCLYKGDLYLYYLVSPSKRNLRATRLIDIQWNIKGLGIISKTHMHISGIIASSPHPV